MGRRLLNLKTLALLAIYQLVVACGGGSGGGLGAASGTFEFAGAQEVTPNPDGTWTVYWQPVLNTSDIRYDVFQRLESGGSFDFTLPQDSTIENSFITSDLRLAGNTCFIVRFRQKDGTTDDNSNEVCTNHEPYSFQGVDSLTSLRDGSYVLKWEEPPFDGAQFQVFSKNAGEEEWKPLELTTDAFYKTRAISLDEQICYMVRYRIVNFPEDTNEKEVCTASGEVDANFAGVRSVDSPDTGQLRVTWEQATREDVEGYNLYLGSDFNRKVMTVEGRESTEAVIPDLLHAVVYTVGVRSVDKFGREDSNTIVLSYELENHLPVVESVVFEPTALDEFGRPTNMSCAISYTDTDTWQTLTPTFEVKNRKRGDVGIVERTITEGEADQQDQEYVLIEDDHRADGIFCRVTVHDGFDNSIVVESADYVIPDTPVQATGLSGTALQDSEIEIVITRGEGLGYTDFDKDNAEAIEFELINGSIESDPPFLCIDGTCTGRFKPTTGFSTNLDDTEPQYAGIRYRVTAGDSTSDWAFALLNIRPVPRALGFDMIAQQDEDRDASAALAEVTDGVSGDVIEFRAYTTVVLQNGIETELNTPAEQLLVRHPLTESAYNGKVVLPASVTPDPANGIGCSDVSKPTWTKDGFECVIPCDADGKCPFVFRPDDGFYGDSYFDYAVVVDGVVSGYATVAVDVQPNLKSTDFEGLTVAGRSFTIQMFEGQGFEGSAGDNDGNGIPDLDLDGIQVSNLVGTDATTLTFVETSSTSNVFEVTFVPSANFSGYARFNYVVTGVRDGRSVESDEGTAEIHFYPYPVATGINIQSMEGRDREFAVASSGGVGGYEHDENDPAKTIKITAVDTAAGSIDQIGIGAGAGDLSCNIAGICDLTYVHAAAYFDGENETDLEKFQYSVVTEIPDTVLNPTDTTKVFVRDPWFDLDPNNKLLESNVAQGNIFVRPVPKVNPVDVAVAEFLDEKPSSLLLTFNLGDEYTHAYGYGAKTVELASNPAFGTITDFDCNLSGVCTATYTPALLQEGYLAPGLQYTVTVDDAIYQPEVGTTGKITSDPTTLDIDVRPMPKGTGGDLPMRENTDFAASAEVLSFALDDKYTHSGSLPIQGLTISELDPGTGVKGALSAQSCTPGVSCTVTYTPTESNWPTIAPNIGEAQLQYTVTVNDAKLGALESAPAVLAVDIRPLPRANDFGSEASPERVLENTPFTLEVGPVANTSPGYYHPYGILAEAGTTGFAVPGYSTAASPPSGSCAAGTCTLSYVPSNLYFTPSGFDEYVDYQVKVLDPELNEVLTSNTARIHLDVYPRPRATGKKMYVLEETVNEITLELAPDATLGGNRDENHIGDETLRKGYAHSRDENVTEVTYATPSRGTLADFDCVGATCTADFTAPVFQLGTVDQFTYEVKIGAVESINTGTYRVEVLPTANANEVPDAVTIEGETLAIDFVLDSEYSHALDYPATKIEIMDQRNGVISITDIGVGDNTCDNTGKCTVEFTPDPISYFTPQDDLQDAWFDYRVFTYSPELGTDIPSNIERVTVNVRPKPKVVNQNPYAIQDEPYAFTIEPTTHYTYAWDPGFVDRIDFSDASDGTLSTLTQDCDEVGTGECGPVSFTPDPGHYGNATFKFNAIKSDTFAVGGEISSEDGSFTVDFRPKPEATSAHFKGWQDQNLDLTIEKDQGFDHPYYDSAPATYRIQSLDILNQPGNGGYAGGIGSEFTCSSSLPYRCTGQFVPNATYYYDAADGYLQSQYNVTISDPKASDIVSLNGLITMEILPVPYPQAFSVWGVESISKNITLTPGTDYTYAGDITPEVNTSVLTGGSFAAAGSGISCSAASKICTGTWDPATADTTGSTSFNYSMSVTDGDLGTYTSGEFTYEVNFYPIPKAQDISSATGYKFLAVEGAPRQIDLVPARLDETLCLTAAAPSGHAGLAPRSAYLHRDCEPAVEVIVSSETNAFFTDPGGGNFFTCDTDGKCTAELNPNSAGGGWPGFGIASFNFRVRIDPDELAAADLSTAERDALTSNQTTVEVEFYPRPYATGITLEDDDPATDFLYAVEGETQPLEITKCLSSDVSKENCHLGYWHGKDDRAISWAKQLESNLTVSQTGCNTSGICTGAIVPANGYISNPGEFATFEYAVTTNIPGYGNVESNFEEVRVHVYPKPIAIHKQAFGREGEVVELVLEVGDGYTHARGETAEQIIIEGIPDQASGWFVDLSAPGPLESKPILPYDLTAIQSAFECTAGRCVAAFKPSASLPDEGADTNFSFRVKVSAPTAMPDSLKDKMQSELKQYGITIYPKPKAQDRQIVVVEGEVVSTEIGINNGYTHGSGLSAQRIELLDVPEIAGGSSLLSSVTINETVAYGSLSSAFDCSQNSRCWWTCSGGTCTANFSSTFDADYLTTPDLWTSHEGGCTELGATCPKVQFYPTVVVAAAGNLELTSDNPAELMWNVRPRPRSGLHQIADAMAIEGATHLITLTRGTDGYAHPFYDASSIEVTDNENGNIAAAFDCVSTSDCTATFVPDAAWTPSSTNRYGRINYKVTVNDPTLREGGAPVGDLASIDEGSLRVEYRPRPVATSISTAVRQDSTSNTLTIQLDQGVTHAYNKDPRNLTILANTRSKINITNAGCADPAANCVIPCTGSPASCVVNYDAAPGQYGTDGGFDYSISIFDDEFIPVALEIESDNTGTASIDIRPKPVAQDLTFHLAEDGTYPFTISKGLNAGYDHPYSGVVADHVNLLSALSDGSLLPGLNCPPSGDGSYGTCTATFVPNSAYFGSANTLSYEVVILDPLLSDTDKRITSDPKTITFDVRPLPHATGLPTDFTLLQNSSRTIELTPGPKTGGSISGYSYPASYDEHLTDVEITTPMSSSVATFTNPTTPFSCSSGADPKGCTAEINGVPGEWGTTSFSYIVKIEDDELSELVSPAAATIDVDIRPLIVANNTVPANNATLYLIEDTPDDVVISNGANLGFEYPTTGDFGDILTNHLAIEDGATSLGTVTAMNCADQECDVTFTPEAGRSGQGSFQFRVSVFDDALPVGQKTIQSQYRTATVDIYPLPVVSSPRFYTVEGRNVSVAIKHGINQGYIHYLDSDPGQVVGADPSAVLVDAQDSVNLQTISSGDFLCPSDTCTATVSPVASRYSSDDSLANAAWFDYRPTVSEGLPGNRVATAATSDKAYITIYPQPIPDATSIQNDPVWEGVTIAVELQPTAGNGYSHPWPGEFAKRIVATPGTNSQLDGIFNCNGAGVCTHSGFTPRSSDGAYGPGKASISYQVENEYNNVDPKEVLSTSSETLFFDLRPVPGVPNGNIAATSATDDFIENTTAKPDTITDVVLSLADDDFVYGGTISNINRIEIIPGDHISCTTCDNTCSGGACTLPTLTVDADKSRATHNIKAEYRYRITDERLGDRWSPNKEISFNVIPRPRGEAQDKEDGIEGVTYVTTVELDAGYTHPEGAKAEKLKVTGFQNLSGLTLDQEITCDSATGICNLSLVPLASGFTDVNAGKTANDTYGWARLEYEIMSTISGAEVWSTPGTLDVLFRPVPKPDDVSADDGIEDETYSLVIRQSGTGGCSSDCGYLYPATETINTTSIRTRNISAGTVAPSCTAGGVCTMSVNRETHGFVTFEYKVTINGVEMLDWANASVEFLPRHRTAAQNYATVEGRAVDITLSKPGAGYSHFPGDGYDKNALNIYVGSLSAGTIQYQTSGGSFSTCFSDAFGLRCPCRDPASTSDCVIKFAPRNFTDADGNNNVGGSFVFETSAIDYLEADGSTPLRSIDQASVNILVEPRFQTFDRSYPAGLNEGLEGSTKLVRIMPGPGGEIDGGYSHICATAGKCEAGDPSVADKILILQATGATVAECGNVDGVFDPPCEVTCTTGTCDFNINPLTDADFVTDATVNYRLRDSLGYESHKSGTASVYFYPRPKGTSESIIIAKGSTNNLLQVGLDAGYTHLEDDQAQTWTNETSPAVGTLTMQTCAAGVCDALFTPPVNWQSSGPSNTLSFDYSLTTLSGTGAQVGSNQDGTFEIEVFPPPEVTNKEYRWIQGVGQRGATVGEEFQITLNRNDDWTHPWAATVAPKIEVSGVVGGSFTNPSDPFTCDLAGECTATFTPTSSLYSTSPDTVAAGFDYQVVVEDYDSFPSATATVDIFIMPVPEMPDNLIVEVRQARGNIKQAFVFKESPAANQTPAEYEGWSHPWAETDLTKQIELSDNETYIWIFKTGEIRGDPNETTACASSTQCNLEYVSSAGRFSGLTNFKYNLTFQHPSYPTEWTLKTEDVTAGINILPLFTVTGRDFNAEQLIDGGTNLVIPKTTVPLRVEIGSDVARLGYTHIDDDQTAMNGFLIIDPSDTQGDTAATEPVYRYNTDLDVWQPAQGNLINQLVTTEGGKRLWKADYESSDYEYGSFRMKYRVCDLADCTDSDALVSPVESDTTKWINFVIDPTDIPPNACAKTGIGGGVVVYRGLPKLIQLQPRTVDDDIITPTSCNNGVWWTDNNPGDSLRYIKFIKPDAGVLPAGTFNLVSDGSVCPTDVDGDVTCTCGTDNCDVTFTPDAGLPNGDYAFTYVVATDSNILPGFFTEALAAEDLMFMVRNPLVPEAVDFTATATNEDVSVNLEISPGAGYKTALQIDGSYWEAPDGYAMLADTIEIVDYDEDIFQSVSMVGPSCIEGVCTISLTLRPDADETSDITFKVFANGEESNVATMTFPINQFDDPPNTYASGETAKRIHKFNEFRDGWQTGAFYKFDDPATTDIDETFAEPLDVQVRREWWNPQYMSNNIAWESGRRRHGYFEAEGHKAVFVRIDPASVTGGSFDFSGASDCGPGNTHKCVPCDFDNGECNLVFTPDGSVIGDPTDGYQDDLQGFDDDGDPYPSDFAKYQYWVTTSPDDDNDDVEDDSGLRQEQPVASEGRIWVASGDHTTITVRHLPEEGVENPDISDEENYPLAYQIGRNSSKSIVIAKGPDGAYDKNEWFEHENTDLAVGVEIGDGTNGADAPVNLELTTAFTCDAAGSCIGTVRQNTILTVFPEEASFWYRVVFNEDYVAPNGLARDYGNNLRVTSEWRKVTMQVILDGGVGCEDQPSVSNSTWHFPIRDQAQGTTRSWSLGAGATAGNRYNHTGSVADGLWRPLAYIEIDETRMHGVTIKNVDCDTTTGVCTADAEAVGADTPGDLTDDFTGHAYWYMTVYDDWGCSQEVRWYANIVPQVALRNVCEFHYADDRYCMQDDDSTFNVGVESDLTVNLKQRDAGQPYEEYNAWHYQSWDDTPITRIRLRDFETADRDLLDTTGGLATAITGPGVTCDEGGNYCDITNCTDGDCSFTINAHDGLEYGWVSVGWDVAQAGISNDSVWARSPTAWFPHSYNSDNLMWHHDEPSRFDIYVKTKPVPTNPVIITGVNQPVVVQLGKEDAPSDVFGYTYADEANFAGKEINISATNPRNGANGDVVFDQNTKILSLDFRPDLNFIGDGLVDYDVSVWGVSGDTGLLTVRMRQYHDPQAVAATTDRDIDATLTLNPGAEYYKDEDRHSSSSAHPYNYPAEIEVVGADYQPLDSAVGTIPVANCDGATGVCTIVFDPHADFVGTASLWYRLKSGPAGELLNSKWASATIDVNDVSIAPVTTNISVSGRDDQTKQVLIYANTGYTDANGDLAATLQYSGLFGATVAVPSPIACEDGICIVPLTPDENFYGEATFQFTVTDPGGLESNTSTATVDFEPQLHADDLTVAGVRNVNKDIRVELDAGYRYNPGSSVTHITIDSESGGTVTDGPEIACPAGICDIEFVPTAEFTGSATIGYSVKVAGTPDIVSNIATITIEIANTDEAPVANDFMVTRVDHDAFDVVLTLDDQYTDRESDKATEFTAVVSPAGAGAIVKASPECDAAGECTFNFDPSAGFSGYATIAYTVTAGGAASNTATITLSLPADDLASFDIVWGAELELDQQCLATIPASVTPGDCGGTCLSEAATIPAALASGGAITENDFDGFTATIDTFTPGVFSTEYAVTGDMGTVTFSRQLELIQEPSALLAAPAADLTPALGEGMPGHQQPVGGCTGGSCSSSQRFGSIAAGGDFSCAVVSGTEIHCWGDNGGGSSFGKLGRNDSVTVYDDEPAAVRDEFDVDFPATGFIAVAAGENHACGLMSNRRVKCWGDNTYGQLGVTPDGGSGISESLVPIDITTNLTKVVAITAGANHTCAVDEFRQAYCWGDNSNGQLGIGDSVAYDYVARRVLYVDAKTAGGATSMTPLDDIIRIDAGASHTCAVWLDVNGDGVTIDGRHAICWGESTNGETGDADFYSLDPADLTQVIDGDPSDDRPYPVLVRAGDGSVIGDVIDVAAGDGYSCALFNDGTVKCWGINSEDQLGSNTSNPSYDEPVSVVGPSGSANLDQVVTISAGAKHACALREDRSVVCWGDNNVGQIGNDSVTTGDPATDDAPYALVVNADDVPANDLDNIIAVSAGAQHTCALSTDGAVKCWGDNQLGQLADAAAGAMANIPTAGAKYSDGALLDPVWRQCSSQYRLVVP